MSSHVFTKLCNTLCIVVIMVIAEGHARKRVRTTVELVSQRSEYLVVAAVLKTFLKSVGPIVL